MQDDLDYLRDATRGRAGEGDAGMDADTLNMVIARTQQGMQTVAERVLQTTQDKIATLPAIARRSKPELHDKSPRQGQKYAEKGRGCRCGQNFFKKSSDS